MSNLSKLDNQAKSDLAKSILSVIAVGAALSKQAQENIQTMRNFNVRIKSNNDHHMSEMVR